MERYTYEALLADYNTLDELCIKLFKPTHGYSGINSLLYVLNRYEKYIEELKGCSDKIRAIRSFRRINKNNSFNDEMLLNEYSVVLKTLINHIREKPNDISRKYRQMIKKKEKHFQSKS